jgi:hypothetical protein
MVLSSKAFAGYPMISDIPNQKIMINSATPVIKFNITDDKTPADKLVLSYKSLNPELIPNSDDNIILAGSGSTRTVQVIPVKDKADVGTVIIIVTDTDGKTNNDAFQVEVVRPPSR